MEETLKQRYQATLKHPDTEEPIDLWFYRPVGFRLALFAERVGWTPNFISVCSIFLGVGCGILCFWPDWQINMLGMLLLVLADICDSADGQLARMTGAYSRLGRILDGASGDIWFVAIYVAIALRLTPEWGIWIWVLAVVAGGFHAVQAATSDYYRNIHLFFVKGKRGSELDDARQVAVEYKALSFAQEPVYKVFMFFYKNYTRNQELLSPQMQRLRRLLRDRFGDSNLPSDYCQAFRIKSLPLMKYANILTFNCRALLLCGCLLAGYPWLYFVGEITLFNLLWIYMVIRHECICRQFAKQWGN